MSGDLNPLAQAEVEAEILRLSRRLTSVTADFAEAAQKAAQTDADYDLAKARALLGLKGHGGTVPEKQAEALLIVEREYRDAKMAEAVARACAEAGRNLRAQLDALRSINANVRTSIDYSRGRGG